MASLRRFPGSRYWFACFIGPDGRQTQRSTKETDKGRAFTEDELRRILAVALPGWSGCSQTKFDLSARGLSTDAMCSNLFPLTSIFQPHDRDNRLSVSDSARAHRVK